MTHMIDAVRPQDRPLGVDYRRDPQVLVAVSLATGAAFVREVFTGDYESHIGPRISDRGEVLRYHHHIGADRIKGFCVAPVFASDLVRRRVDELAWSTHLSSLVDTTPIWDLTAGSHAAPEIIHEVKQAVRDDVPALLNGGSRARNIQRFLQ